MCALEIGLAGIRTQGLRLAKAALYQLSYKPGYYAQLTIINSWLFSFWSRSTFSASNWLREGMHLHTNNVMR